MTLTILTKVLLPLNVEIANINASNYSLTGNELFPRREYITSLRFFVEVLEYYLCFSFANQVRECFEVCLTDLFNGFEAI